MWMEHEGNMNERRCVIDNCKAGRIATLVLCVICGRRYSISSISIWRNASVSIENNLKPCPARYSCCLAKIMELVGAKWSISQSSIPSVIRYWKNSWAAWISVSEDNLFVCMFECCPMYVLVFAPREKQSKLALSMLELLRASKACPYTRSVCAFQLILKKKEYNPENTD